MLRKIQAGENPQRPYDGIAHPVWEFIERCWSRDPANRPLAGKLCKNFSEFSSLPQDTHAPDGRAPIEALPGKLKLQARSVKLSLKGQEQRQFFVKFKYGNKDHTTSLTKAVAGDEHTWFVFSPFPLLLPSLNFNQGQS